MTEQTEFKRMRFFTGLFTTARDWEAEQDYHREKLKLHNRGLHTPGIIHGVADELNVVPAEEPKVVPAEELNVVAAEKPKVVAARGPKLQVRCGAAIDSAGNIIYLGKACEVVIDREALDLHPTHPHTAVTDVYVVASYSETPADYTANVSQPEYSGHTRVAERPSIKVTREKPDNKLHLELARIRLRHNADSVGYPADPQNPGVNEIDRRFLAWSWDAGSLDQRLDGEEAKSVEFDQRLDTEEHKSVEVQNTLEAHHDWLGTLENKSGELAGRLKIEEGKSADHETRLVTEEGKSADHETRLALQAVISAQHETRLGAEEERSREFEALISQEEAKSEELAAGLMSSVWHQRLHLRRQHTPGVLRGEGADLAVRAAGGLDVSVLTGAAQDEEGHTLILDEPRTITIDPSAYDLPDIVFIAIGHHAGPSGPHTHLVLTTDKPDNQAWLELARIRLQPGVTEIRDPADSHNPGANQINRTHVLSAGAVGAGEPTMTAETLQQLIDTMERTRRDFAALDDRFPTPSAADVRHAALTVETLAHIGCLRPGQLPDLFVTLAAIEQDVKQELHKKYENEIDTGKKTGKEFHAYVTALRNLQDSLELGEEQGILTAQNRVAAAARELSEIAIESPIADAGRDQTAATFEDETTIILDGSRSRGRSGRDIASYRWESAA
jgi:hypothetical protein